MERKQVKTTRKIKAEEEKIEWSEWEIDWNILHGPKFGSGFVFFFLLLLCWLCDDGNNNDDDIDDDGDDDYDPILNVLKHFPPFP